jgi:hypothetical protein
MALMPRNHWLYCGVRSLKKLKNAIFPVLFPVCREFDSRDGFEDNCFRRHETKREFPICSPRETHFVREKGLWGYTGLQTSTPSQTGR